MKLILLFIFEVTFATSPALAQPAPALRVEVVSEPVTAIKDQWPTCGARDIPDAPARAVRLADNTVQLYATDQENRVDVGPDLGHLQHRCAVVYRGGENDDPGAYDDRAWIASPWTWDGHTIWAVVHNEFHGHLRKALCPTGQYMDCWFNSLTLVVSHDDGRSFQRATRKPVVAALPYRYDEVGLGHHGYFNSSNVVTLDGYLYMFAFVTHANAQHEGNCLLRTDSIEQATSWRGWDGDVFTVDFADPYASPIKPEHHLCKPVGVGALRWPVTSLVRHSPTGLFIATMQNTAPGGGVYYATSPDLLRWSSPALLLPAVGLPAWTCGSPDPIAYPSLLDAASGDRNFQTVASSGFLFATHFSIERCHPSMDRSLIRWNIRISQ